MIKGTIEQPQEELIKIAIDSLDIYDLPEDTRKGIVNDCIDLLEHYQPNEDIPLLLLQYVTEVIASLRVGRTSVEIEKRFQTTKKEMQDFVKLLFMCEGNDIVISGSPNKQRAKTARNQGIIVPDPFKVTITDWDFLKKIGIIAAMEKHKYIEFDTSKDTNYTKNQFLGNISLNLYYPIMDFDYGLKKGTKTKIYSFIYDVLLLGGAKGVEDLGETEEGKGKDFSGYLGKEKFQKVRVWIKACQKKDEDNAYR